jgi:hypothetical protein
MKSAILCVGSHTTKVGRSGEEEPMASITTANGLGELRCFVANLTQTVSL